MNLNILIRLITKKFISQTLDAKIKQKGLLDKSAIAVFVINVDLDKKNVATLATKSELKGELDKIIKLQPFDCGHFRDKSILKIMVLHII